jgi:flagellar basal body-associated protein FliL
MKMKGRRLIICLIFIIIAAVVMAGTYYYLYYMKNHKDITEGTFVKHIEQTIRGYFV